MENNSMIILKAGSLEKEVVTLSNKDQEESVFYQFSMENRIGNQTIKSVSWTSTADNIDIDKITTDKQTFKCLISGGTNYHNVGITFKATTSGGETRTFNCVLPIRPEGALEKTTNSTVIVVGGGSPEKGEPGEKGDPGKDGTSLNFLSDEKDAFFGDSITGYKDQSVGGASYPFGDVTSVFLTWWKQLTDKTGATITTNNSYAGSLISNPSWLSNNTSLLTRIPALPTDTDICFILMGVNDFRNGIGFAGLDFTKTEWNVDYFDDSVCKAMIDMNTHSPATRFVWIGILGDFTGGYNPTPNKNKYDKTVPMYNDILERCCKQYGNIYIDPTEAFSYLSSNCFIDGLHPNAFGMKRLANLVLNKITNILG